MFSMLTAANSFYVGKGSLITDSHLYTFPNCTHLIKILKKRKIDIEKKKETLWEEEILVIMSIEQYNIFHDVF